MAAPPIERAADERLRRTKWWIAGSLGLLLIVGLIAGGVVTKVVVGLICLTALQGLWKGATGLAGLVAGLAVAVLVAPPIGRALEGVVGSIGGLGGLANRFTSMAVAALLVVALVAFASGIGVRRVMRARPGWKRWDPFVGVGFGLLEGVFLALLMLWVPLSLEPVARAQVESAAAMQSATGPLAGGQTLGRPTGAPGAEPPEAARGNVVSAGVVAYAGRVRASLIGGIAEALNPIKGARILSLANDFVAVSADPGAIEHFRESEVMRFIAALPSVRQALRMCEEDAELRRVVESGRMSHAALSEIMNSETVLRIFDETTIVRDLTPMTESIALAIVDAKAQVGRPPADPAPEPLPTLVLPEK